MLNFFRTYRRCLKSVQEEPVYEGVGIVVHTFLFLQCFPWPSASVFPNFGVVW